MSTLDQRNERALGGDSNLPAGVTNATIDAQAGRDGEACDECEGEGVVDCEECAGEGCDACACNGVVECDACEGAGENCPPTREEIECDKADRAMDDAKDEPRE